MQPPLLFSWIFRQSCFPLSWTTYFKHIFSSAAFFTSNSKMPITSFVSFLLLLSTTSISKASPFLSFHPKASALGNAVTAEQVGTSSASFNPATLTKITTGRSGRLKEYTLMALPFPSIVFEANKPPPARDPFIINQQLFVDDLTGTDVFNDGDPRDNPLKIEPDRIIIYIPGVGEIGDIDNSTATIALLPLFSNARRSKNNRFVFTSGITVLPGGLSLKRQDYHTDVNSVAMGLIRISPTIAYQITDTFSIGAGINYSAAGFKLGIDYRQPGPTIVSNVVNLLQRICSLSNDIASTETCRNLDLDTNDDIFYPKLEADDLFNLGWNAGALWSPNVWFSWGLSYRHETKYDMKGDFSVTIGDELFTVLDSLNADLLVRDSSALELILGSPLVKSFSGDLLAKFTIPTQISTGISVNLTPRFKLNVDYHWKESSVYNNANLNFSNFSDPSGEVITDLALATATGLVSPYDNEADLGIGNLTKFYLSEVKDTGNFAFGVSFQATEQLTLRAGYEKRGTSFSGEVPLGIPLNNFRTRGFGLNYLWDAESTLDLTYVNISMKGFTAAGEGLVNSASPLRTTIALWAGSDLDVNIEAHILQVAYNKFL